MGHIGVIEATKKSGSMVPRTVEFILLNSASRKQRTQSNPEDIQGR